MRTINELTREEVRAVILGTLLGDSTLQGGKQKYIYMGQCDKQKEFLDWKIDCLNHYIRVGNHKWSYQPKNPRYQLFHKFTSTTHHKLTAMYNWVYIDGKRRITSKVLDRLNEVGLATLFMDDGSKVTQWYNSHKNKFLKSFKFATNCFPLEDVTLFRNWLLEKFGIETKLYYDYGQPMVFITTIPNKYKFVDLVKPYILPCMQYKIQVEPELAGKRQRKLQECDLNNHIHIMENII